MDIVDESVDRTLLKRDIMDILDRYYGASLKEIKVGEILNQLAIPLITKYQARMPPEFTLIIRVVSIIEDVAFTLDEELDATALFKPMIKKNSGEEIQPPESNRPIQGEHV